ncbi:MAG TPA: tetratricopeptide repeat protein [Acetobacteraceae bacterium]|nr:tetratricopeptide repeat protein [Acetobacteraceae bacterium]
MPPDRDSAFLLLRQGRLAEAEPLLRAVLAAAPEDAESLRALAQLRFMAGAFGEALALIERLLARDPRDAAALNSKGAILTAGGRPAEALAAYDAAIAIAPDLARAHANRAVALAALGRAAEALEAAEAALAREPGHAGALASRGMALLALGRAAKAVPALEAAIAVDPGHLAARLDLAAALLALDRGAEAEAAAARVLAAQPEYRPALLLQARALFAQRKREAALDMFRRLRAADAADVEAILGEGNALAALGRHEAALACFTQAATLRPDDPDAHNNLGNTLSQLGRPAEALAAFERALALDPDHANAHANRGVTLIALGRLEEAVAALDAALARDPEAAETQVARACALLDLNRTGEACDRLEELLSRHPGAAYLRVALLAARRKLADWRDEARCLPGLAENVIATPDQILPWWLLTLVDSPAAHLAVTRAWTARLFPASCDPLWRGERYAHDRIRVAYLSPDFRDHPVSNLAVGLFERHDRARFEITALALGAPPKPDDPLFRRLRAAFEHFLPVESLSDEAIARLVREREVDILVDLGGHTRGARTGVLARRAAPVQVAFLGYAGSMGADYVDYLLADRIVVPPGDDGFYTERVVRLPDTFLPADDRRPIAAPRRRAEEGLPERGFVFCSFNGYHKLHPGIFDIWMRLLDAVPGSVLWLNDGPAEAMANLRREAQARGVDGARLVFARPLPMAQHLARQGCADLFLDTIPYNAHTTASDALWGGLPVLTMPGRAFAGRVAASLLAALGMEALIAPSPAEYEALALALARDPARLRGLREQLVARRRSAPAFDTDRFRRHVEAAYATMHDRARRGLPPESFDVTPVDGHRAA